MLFDALQSYIYISYYIALFNNLCLKNKGYGDGRVAQNAPGENLQASEYRAEQWKLDLELHR